MGVLNLLSVATGVALVAVGWSRARGPYARYQALRAQDENVARYERWRGGTRSTESTGASVAMEMLRRKARIGIFIVGLGGGLILLGFLARL